MPTVSSVDVKRGGVVSDASKDVTSQQGGVDIGSFDHHAIDHHDGIDSVWARMRQSSTLPYSHRHGGFYVITRHADLRHAAGHHELFTSAQGIALPDQDRSRHIPAEMDPPEQREYRRLLAPFLTPQTVARYEVMMRARANALLDAIGDREEVEFVAGFAKPFPILVSLELFGFPLADADRLDAIITGIIDQRGTAVGRANSQALSDYLVGFLSEKAAAATDPHADMISAIALGEVGGRRLSMDEKISMTRLLLFGGFTTVMNALSYAVYLFATRPELVRRLQAADEKLWTTAVDELVRLASPATYLRRNVTRNTELGGTALQPGEQVLLCFAAANRDPDVFPSPDELDIERSPNPHVGFGHGAHRCMGVSVAKLEMRVALGEILKRYAAFELASPERVRWDAGETQGIGALPLRWQRREVAG